jgi:hypothetical protein
VREASTLLRGILKPLAIAGISSKRGRILIHEKIRKSTGLKSRGIVAVEKA